MQRLLFWAVVIIIQIKDTKEDSKCDLIRDYKLVIN